MNAQIRAAIGAAILALVILPAPGAHASGWHKVCSYQNKVVVCKEVRR